MQFEIGSDGTVKSRDGRVAGYIKDNVVFSGGSGGYGGQQAGYIQGDVIFAGGSGVYGGQQVGYVQGNDVYAGGGGGPYGGQRVGPAEFPHPRWKAAVHFLLT